MSKVPGETCSRSFDAVVHLDNAVARRLMMMAYPSAVGLDNDLASTTVSMLR